MFATLDHPLSGSALNRVLKVAVLLQDSALKKGTAERHQAGSRKLVASRIGAMPLDRDGGALPASEAQHRFALRRLATRSPELPHPTPRALLSLRRSLAFPKIHRRHCCAWSKGKSEATATSSSRSGFSSHFRSCPKNRNLGFPGINRFVLVIRRNSRRRFRVEA